MLANPVIESFRIEIASKGPSRNEVRGRRLSGIELRPRRVPRGEARARPGGRSSSGTRRRRSAAPTSSSCRAGSRMATTCGPAPSRGSRRSWRRSSRFAERGGPVLGICNGFQILLECGLLPGAMLRNRDLKFHCEYVGVRVEQTDTPFTGRCTRGTGAALADRARRGQLLRAARRARARSSPPAASCFATLMPSAS